MRFREDSYNWWPKHVAGYTVYNTVNLHVFMINIIVIYMGFSQNVVLHHDVMQYFSMTLALYVTAVDIAGGKEAELV